MSLLIGSLLAFATQGGTLPIEEAVRIATENAYSVLLARAQARQAEARARAAEGVALWPKLNSSARYTRFDQRTKLAGGIYGPIDSKQIQFVMSLPLDITGVGRAGAAGPRLFAEASRSTLEAEIQSVRAGVRAAYYLVLKAFALIGVATEQLAASRDRLDRTKRRFDVGQVARFDVVRLETEVTRAEGTLTAAKNNLRLAKNSLNGLLARPIDAEFEPVDASEVPPNPGEAAEFVAAAHRTRPEVRAATTRAEGFARLRRAEEGGLLPLLSFSATHTRVIGPSQFERLQQTTAGAEIRWPIFDGGVTHARAAAAREDERQAQIALEQIKLGVALDVRQAFVRLENAATLLQTAKKQVEQEGESLRIANLRFDEGAGILLDVTRAQAGLTAAKTDEVAARYEYLSAYAALQRAVGADDLPAALKIKEETNR